MRNFEPFWNRACASCRRTVQRAACVPASALSTATRFVEYRLTDGHSVGAAPGNHWGSISSCSYIKPQLVRFGTTFSEHCLSSCSYIKPQLASRGRRPRGGCLSSCSYIKPQLARIHALISYVVYHLVPTSNHNQSVQNGVIGSVVYHLVSYIKPQRSPLLSFRLSVVYHLVPTSNHNHRRHLVSSCKVVYHLVPTSNHNCSSAST